MNKHKVLSILLACLAFSSSDAAEFSFDNRSGEIVLTLSGVIKRGDEAKLRRLIADRLNSYRQTATVLLDSTGGNVEEAIKIAQLFEQSGQSVFVDTNATCASACFLIYVSAPLRASPGSIVIHRPYFDMTELSGSSHEAASKAYQSSIQTTRAFLQSRSVPSDLVDKMMEKPSNDGYMLTSRDKLRIGFMSPAIEEVAVQNCGLRDKSELFEPSSRTAFDCVRTFLANAKIAYLIQLYAVTAPASERSESERNIDKIFALRDKFKATDPDFERKWKLTAPEIVRIMKAFPPSAWVREVEAVYKGL